MYFTSKRNDHDESLDLTAHMTRDEMIDLLFNNYRGSMADLLFVKVMEGMSEKFVDECGKDIIRLIDPQEILKEVKDRVVSEISERLVSAITSYQQQINISSPSGRPFDEGDLKNLVRDLREGG